MPSARKFSAVPETIWSARSETANSAWMSASAPPAAIAITRPQTHEPVTSAPQTPKNAPISIMPSSAMLIDAASARRTGRRARANDQRRRVAQHRGEQRAPRRRPARGCPRPTASRVPRRACRRTRRDDAPQPSRRSPPRDRARAGRQRRAAEHDRRHRRADQRSAARATKNARTPSAMPRPADAARRQPPRPRTRSTRAVRSRRARRRVAARRRRRGSRRRSRRSTRRARRR